MVKVKICQWKNEIDDKQLFGKIITLSYLIPMHLLSPSPAKFRWLRDLNVKYSSHKSSVKEPEHILQWKMPSESGHKIQKL